MICESCGKEHNGSYGSGRFCCAQCRSRWARKIGSKKGSESTKLKFLKIRREKLDSVLHNNSNPNILKGNLKDYLFEFSLKERKCEICSLTKWQNKPIPLQLHHIDGNHSNNLLENLQIVCPNCHAQTDTYGFRNMNKKIKESSNLQ